MKRLLPLCALLCATLPAFAFIDTNNNGLSDLWERTYNNGQLFDLSFDLQADADGDGWTNAQEAAAGTNPFDPNPPDGYLRPDIVHVPAVWSDTDFDEIPDTISTPEAFTITWTTIPGKQYTLLYSPDLIEWLALEPAFIGNGSVVVYGYDLTEDDKLFWRVKIDDVDSDGDGLTDAEEYILGTDPTLADSDEDGMPDAWEVKWGLNPLDPADAAADADDDGLTNAQEYAHGTDPNHGDSDNDGITDGGEVEQATDPNNPADTPAGERLVLTGDLDEGVVKSSTRTVTIPAGRCCVVIVAVASDEYPDWTGITSEFNDVLTWQVSPSSGQALSGNLDVNSRHSQWEADELAGTTIQGFFPAHLEEYRVYQAPPDADLSIPIQLSATNTSDGSLPSTVMVGLLPFEVRNASIREGQFTVSVPTIMSGTLGTLDLILQRSGSTTAQVVLRTLTNQAPGNIGISLDDIMDHGQSPLDGHDTERYDCVSARWRVGTVDITSGDKNLDVHAVEVLENRLISNYFSPIWGGTWGGTLLQKGVYPAGNFPADLQNVDLRTEFLNALDPQNEGLAMDGNTVIRLHQHPAQQGYNRVEYLPVGSGVYGYIENPDRDQDNASSPSVVLLRATSVAVRTDADRLAYDDEVYVPSFSVRTVDDSGTLHGNTSQIDVWRGQGDGTLRAVVNAWNNPTRTCLKIIQP